MLKKIVAEKRREAVALRQSTPVSDMQRRIAEMDPVVSLRENIADRSATSIIAEVKRHSPSKGPLAENVDVAARVRCYERAGAHGISVLTDKKYFRGSIDDLRTARQHTTLPILRKDFIVHEAQVYETRLIGSDALLLIAAVLRRPELSRLHSLARSVGLEVLVEVRTDEEVARAIDVGAEMIGINNRDLATFQVSLETTERLRHLVPDDIVCVAESGIRCREDLVRMERAGVNAVLVGESLMVSTDPEATIWELLGRNHDPR